MCFDSSALCTWEIKTQSEEFVQMMSLLYNPMSLYKCNRRRRHPHLCPSHTHAYTCIYGHTRIYAHKHTHTHIHIHEHTHARTPTHTHTYRPKGARSSINIGQHQFVVVLLCHDNFVHDLYTFRNVFRIEMGYSREFRKMCP